MSGGVLRIISTMEPIICSSIPSLGFGVVMVGQVLTACGQPFLLYSPTTLASVWFGPKERAVATGLTSLGEWAGWPVRIMTMHLSHMTMHLSHMTMHLTWPVALASHDLGVGDASCP